MKRVLIACMIGIAAGALAQEQAGVAAKMETVNGKVVPVYLQQQVGGKLIFQVYKKPTDMPAVDISKIASFEFLTAFDAKAIESLYAQGDYTGIIERMQADMKPNLAEYWQYMPVQNNFQDAFCSLMEAYLKIGDFASASMAASNMLQNADDSIHSTAQAVSVQVALEQGDIDRAEAMLDEVDSEAGKLYLRACIERARQQPDSAIWLLCELIENHGNDLDWMPEAELLCADIYMDLSRTNSAINTASQVKDIYRGLNVSAEAEKLEAELIAMKEKAEAEAALRAEEEAARQAEVKARAEARAAAANVDEADNETETPSGDESGQDGEVQE